MFVALVSVAGESLYQEFMKQEEIVKVLTKAAEQVQQAKDKDVRLQFKNSHTPKIAVIILKVEQCGFYYRSMHSKNADRMANSVDLDQNAPIWDYTVCLDLSVQKIRIVTVNDTLLHVWLLL